MILKINFKQWVLELWYFTWVFLVLWQDLSVKTNILTCGLNLGVWLYFFKSLSLLSEWTVRVRTLLFHMSILWNKNFPWVPTILPCDLDLGVWPTFWKLINFVNNNGIVSGHLWPLSGAFVFHKHIWLQKLLFRIIPFCPIKIFLVEINCFWFMLR